MIFQPNKKIFINQDDYLEVLIKLLSAFLRPEKFWLESYEIEFFRWCLKAHDAGIQLASRKFVPWMLANSPYSDKQVLDNYKSKLTRKKWIVRSEHGVMFPKVITDFIESIKRGDKALECRFLMDFVPDKDLDVLHKTPHEMHPITEVRVNKILKDRKTLLKQEKNVVFEEKMLELQKIEAKKYIVNSDLEEEE